MELNDFGLTAEQMEKVKSCKTPEEVLALAKEEGIDLTDEQIEGISGGSDWTGCSGFLSGFAF